VKNFLSALLYYLVLVPASIAPFWLIHINSRIIYFLAFKIIGYRKNVVRENIRNSFPGKSSGERKKIENEFFKNLADTLLEGFKIFTISKKNLVKHISCKNPEVLNAFYDKGKSVIIAVGHYNSWELMLTGFNTFIKHKAVVIYQPLSNSFLDKKLRDARSERGTIMLPAKETKNFFQTPSEDLYATVFAIDQSPPNPERAYWMKFLNQDTPVLFGTEKYAKDFKLPVVYARLVKIKRGYYQLEFETAVEEPSKTQYGEITEKVTHLLEKDIIASPEAWLWSHKRWKHKRDKGQGTRDE
jgi:KDO2-lipid IV(A) lauroyltransferase